ncbi:MAG: hypothetical protein ABJE47_02320 [bacterium]
MTSRQGRLPSLSAALAGIPAGIQTIGPWAGRRQLFVRFAGEAETATIYSADALRGELVKLSARSRYHSVAITGRDALIEEEFLNAALSQPPGIPVMLDHDGQHPAALDRLLSKLALMQVTLDGTEGSAALQRVVESVRLAAGKQVAQAVVILPADNTSDAPLLRIVEQLHEASESTQIVVHVTAAQAGEHDRRWTMLLEQAMRVHTDVRVLPRWPAAGTRNTVAG